MIGYVVVLGVGYVMGTKAGRGRYHQIVNVYHSVIDSPATKALIEHGRRRIANKIHPDSQTITLTDAGETITVIQPKKSSGSSKHSA